MIGLYFAFEMALDGKELPGIPGYTVLSVCLSVKRTLVLLRLDSDVGETLRNLCLNEFWRLDQNPPLFLCGFGLDDSPPISGVLSVLSN